MSIIRVVSIDMFQTLIDVNRLCYRFWQRVLGENSSKTLADKYTKWWGILFPDYFNGILRQQDCFMNLKTIFERFFGEFFTQFHIDFEPKRAAQIQIDIHRSAPPYEDTALFLERIRERFPVCLVTDSDNEMILPHLYRYPFDAVFISERLKTYKNDRENGIFQIVIRHYALPPEMILHIGDSYSDVSGASKTGIKTCWLNRDGKKWSRGVKPDYEVDSLVGAAAILNKREN